MPKIDKLTVAKLCCIYNVKIIYHFKLTCKCIDAIISRLFIGGCLRNCSYVDS